MHWYEVSKVLSVVEAMRVKFKDNKYIAEEELAELPNDAKYDAKILSLAAWDNGGTIYRYQKATISCEIKGFNEPSLLIFFSKARFLVKKHNQERLRNHIYKYGLIFKRSPWV